MKRKISFIFVCISVLGFAQEQETPTSREVQLAVSFSNIERYNVDYKILNYSFMNGDSTILNQINLDELEAYRSPTENVHVIDPTTGLDVLLFYRKNQGILPVNK